MTDEAANRAVRAARETVRAAPDAVAAWRWVTRLDGRPPYLLVGLSSGSGGWVVAVSADAEIRGRAVDPDGADAWWTSVTDELVWSPGSASRSQLYPLRRGSDGGLVDHAGDPVPDHPASSG